MYLYSCQSGADIQFLKFSICDLFCFQWIFIFTICFAPKLYGYPDFYDRIKANK